MSGIIGVAVLLAFFFFGVYVGRAEGWAACGEFYRRAMNVAGVDAAKIRDGMIAVFKQDETALVRNEVTETERSFRL